MKSKVDIAGINIKILKKTRNSDLLFKVHGNHNASRLKNIITNYMDSTKVIMKANYSSYNEGDMVIHIMDIESRYRYYRTWQRNQEE